MRYWLLALLLVVAGCSTSKDAVETGGSFQFVAPGGQTELTYRDIHDATGVSTTTVGSASLVAAELRSARSRCEA